MLTRAWVVIAVSSVSCAAQEEPGTLAWFRAAWDAVPEAALPAGFGATWTEVTRVPVASQEEIDLLRAEAEGHPDHPNWRRIERMELGRRAGGTFVQTHRLWVGPDGWRLSTDNESDASQPFQDVVVCDGHSWLLQEGSLVIADPRDERQGYEHRKYLAAVDVAGYLVHGGFALGRRGFAYEPAESEVVGDRWRGRAISARGTHEMEYTGRIVDGRVLVDRMELIRADGMEGAVGSGWTFGEWAWSEALGRPVAHHAEQFQPDGRVAREVDLVSIEPVERRRFEELSRVPSYEEADAIRGKLGPSSFTDVRAGVHRSAVYDGVALVDDESMPMSPTGGMAWRGVAAVVVVAGALLGIGVWRHMRS